MSIYTATNALVATTPRHLVLEDGTTITSFRIAEEIVNDHTRNNWFTVTVFGGMATWAREHVTKGSRWDFQGHLIVRDWDNGDRSGTSVEIEAALIRKSEQHAHECNCSNHKSSSN
jgi:single-strand DNA-binding protein